MAFLVNGAQPRSARAFVQAGRRSASHGLTGLAALLCVTSIGACSNYHTAGPEAWWHMAVGGKIAEERPPPPGDTDPYPNLATIPPKPAKINVAVWNQMTAGLITDRLKARDAAAIAPIPPPSAAVSSSSLPGPGQPQAPQPGASASLVAASTPPVAAPPAPRAAPVPSAPATATVPAPAATPGPTPPAAPAGNAPAGNASGATVQTASATVPPTLPAGASAADRVANGQLPALPTEAPPVANIVTAPPPSPTFVPVEQIAAPPGSLAAAPAAPPAMPAPAAPAAPVVATAPSGSTGIDFDLGSGALNDAALTEVKALAAARGDHGIAITGYGDGATQSALGQAATLTLALSRAQNLATALVAQGVPYARLRLSAEALGRGASLRLLQ